MANFASLNGGLNCSPIPGAGVGFAAPEPQGATMVRKINTIASVIAALIVGAGLIGTVRAQDCPRGDLDKAYCDRDGDLVADTPSDREATGRSVDDDFLLYAGRRPGRLSEGVGRIHQTHGNGDRKEGGVFPGTVKRGTARSDALGPSACGRRSTPAAIQLR